MLSFSTLLAIAATVSHQVFAVIVNPQDPGMSYTFMFRGTQANISQLQYDRPRIKSLVISLGCTILKIQAYYQHPTGGGKQEA